MPSLYHKITNSIKRICTNSYQYMVEGNNKHGLVDLISVIINFNVIHYVQLWDQADYYLSSVFYLYQHMLRPTSVYISLFMWTNLVISAFTVNSKL